MPGGYVYITDEFLKEVSACSHVHFLRPPVTELFYQAQNINEIDPILAQYGIRETMLQFVDIQCIFVTNRKEDERYTKEWEKYLGAFHSLYTESCSFQCNHQLRKSYLGNTYDDSDFNLLVIGRPKNATRFVMLGFANMRISEWSDWKRKWLQMELRLGKKDIVSLPFHSDADMWQWKDRILFIDLFCTRYHIGSKILLPVIEGMIAEVLHCRMIFVKAIPKAYTFYVERGYYRTWDGIHYRPAYPYIKKKTVKPVYVSHLKTYRGIGGQAEFWKFMLKDRWFRSESTESGYLLGKWVNTQRYFDTEYVLQQVDVSAKAPVSWWKRLWGREKP